MRDVAMHIAAPTPQFVRRTRSPADASSASARSHREGSRSSGKPEPMIEKIVEGQIAKCYEGRSACSISRA